MPVSQGSAGGLPGLNLKAWAQVSSAGVLRRGFNVASVTQPSTGNYSLVLIDPVGVKPVVKVTQGFVGHFSGSGGGSNVGVACFSLAGAAQSVDFYAEVYD